MEQEKQDFFTETDNFADLSGYFLLAMPGMDSGIFDGSLVYLFEHTPESAGGVIINRVTDVELSELLERFELEAPADLEQQWVFFGGPVQPMRGFVLHPKSSLDEEAISDEVESQVVEVLELSNSRDILQDYVLGRGPDNALICFGYAGWGEGQLEDEIRQNVWLTIPANNHDLIFKHPVHDRYHAALAILGIELSSLSSQIGHA